MDTGSCSKILFPQPSRRVRVAWGEGACSSKVHLPLSILFSGCWLAQIAGPNNLDAISKVISKEYPPVGNHRAHKHAIRHIRETNKNVFPGFQLFLEICYALQSFQCYAAKSREEKEWFVGEE